MKKSLRKSTRPIRFYQIEKKRPNMIDTVGFLKEFPAEPNRGLISPGPGEDRGLILILVPLMIWEKWLKKFSVLVRRGEKEI